MGAVNSGQIKSHAPCLGSCYRVVTAVVGGFHYALAGVLDKFAGLIYKRLWEGTRLQCVDEKLTQNYPAKDNAAPLWVDADYRLLACQIPTRKCPGANFTAAGAGAATRSALRNSDPIVVGPATRDPPWLRGLNICPAYRVIPNKCPYIDDMINFVGRKSDGFLRSAIRAIARS
ncbi:hypothetical protein EVAR_94064_1 [Eumeta japonica]|uniref:Uncharacterized protein n=1 Tax=Eumeta variegata TaxID=151549 RepID=A0A4C1V5I7_EUMVA|nr:hypothetical protein EVAR_94064_1 [Eumeta japonica]